LTIQVAADFAPAWGVTTARFTVGGRGDKIHFFDSGHQAGDYGWHIVDGHGLPYAHVFTDPSISAGSDWITGPDAISVTASHEALEMLADPAANEYSFNGARLMWAREVCDVVQANTRDTPSSTPDVPPCARCRRGRVNVRRARSVLDGVREIGRCGVRCHPPR
jgi:hypothetical protein